MSAETHFDTFGSSLMTFLKKQLNNSRHGEKSTCKALKPEYEYANLKA